MYYPMEQAKRTFTAIAEELDYLGINLKDLTCRGIQEEEFPSIFSLEEASFHFGASRGCFVPYYTEGYVFKFDFFDDQEEYCDREVELYWNAQRIGIADAFVKTEFFGYIQGVPVYIQEQVPITEASLDKISGEELASIEKVTAGHYVDMLPEKWLQDFLEYHGAAMLEKFLDFIETEGINDLHFCNVGYIDYRPVTFDFAGFYEESD